MVDFRIATIPFTNGLNDSEEGKRLISERSALAPPDIHISCDTWTAPNRLGILASNAHFTDESFKLRALTISQQEI